MAMDDILNSLNEAQLKAVKLPRAPVLMLAGPGTGKTRTLIARVIYQIEQFGINSEQILALTFSNKASQEMQQRLEKILGRKAQKVQVSTIHSFCLTILRKYHQLVELAPYFSVCDQNYQLKLIAKLISDKGHKGSEAMQRGVRMAIDQHLMRDKPLPPFSAMIYDQYKEYLKKHKLIDFNQILVKTRDLFLTHNDICDQFAEQYQAIHVDEFQDTDVIQYELIKMLAVKHKNIFAVADDDQSIYTWRGANPENIQKYMEDFNVSQPIHLEINYRSGQKIIDAAHVIVKNTERIEPGKVLRAGDIINDSVNVRFFDHEEQEIKYIITRIEQWISRETPLSEMAVLYPQHRFAEKLTLKLISEKIHFQQALGHNFSDDPQMKKVLLYLQLIRDPLDTLILQDLVESELGYNTHKQLQNWQHILKVNYKRALYAFSLRDDISEELKRQLTTFIGNLANLINLKSFYNFGQLLHQILIGFQDFDKSYIEEQVDYFSPFESPRESLTLFDKSKKIWLYHQDVQMEFIAHKMLLHLGIDAQRVDEKNLKKVRKIDVILNLSANPFPFQNQSVDLYTLTSEKRESPFSSLLRVIQDNLSFQENVFNSYVVFDLETTGRDAEKCGIVEIAAVKVKDKKITETFQTLVNPQMAIEKEASSVHHISDEDVKDQPKLEDIWQSFKTFIADDILIAHNGYAFDFRIIDRYAQKLDGEKVKNVRYDSLIFSRQMYPAERNSIDALAEKFSLDPGDRHRALDDVKVLHLIFQRILNEFNDKQKKINADFLFEYVGLANFLQNTLTVFEDKAFFFAGIQKLLSPFSEIMEDFCERFDLNKEDLLSRISEKAYQLNPEVTVFNHKDDFKIKLFKIAAEFSSLDIDKAIADFLSTIMLTSPQDNLADLNAVSLLTYHAAKGLEFKKVIIMGMEDENMPSYFAYQQDDLDDRTIEKKIDEQKRLLYVALTRAKDEIILTAVKNRHGRIQKSSPFLREILNYMKENT